MAFSRMTKNVKNVSMLPDAVQGQSNELKNTFDQAGVDLKDALNELIEELEANTSASNLGAFKNGVNTTVQEYLDSMNTKLSTVEEGANAYTLPEATDEILGGIRVGATTEIVNGKLEAKGLPAPDDVAREAIFSHANNETIHLTADEKIAIRELEENSKGFSSILDTGVSGVIEADSLIFDVTTDMVGKRIICSRNTGRQINLPSAAEVGKGAIIEIESSDGGQKTFIKIHCENSNIIKGDISDKNCVQLGRTVRKYVSTGTSWITNFEKITTNDIIDVEVNPLNTGVTALDDLSELKHFNECGKVCVIVGSDITLTENLFLEEMTLIIYSPYQSRKCITIPNEYKIHLHNAHLRLNGINFEISGTGFSCSGVVTVILGGWEGVKIKTLENADTNVFYVDNNGEYFNKTAGSGILTISLRSCYLETSHLEEYTSKANLIKSNTSYSIPVIFLELRKLSTSRKEDTFKWFDDSDTISRIGTSALYTVG